MIFEVLKQATCHQDVEAHALDLQANPSHLLMVLYHQMVEGVEEHHLGV